MVLVKEPTTASAVDLRLFLALELSATTWRLAFGDGTGKHRQVPIDAGDAVALASEIAKAKQKFGLEESVEILSCYEAGRDGFWVHRFLESIEIHNVVIDAASLKVDRRARRAKTDRIDAQNMLVDLQRYHGGEKAIWRVVRVPSDVEEDNRRPPRELERLKKERTQHAVRIRALLATQGISGKTVKSLLDSLDSLETYNGRPLGAKLKADLRREGRRYDLVCSQIREIEREQREEVKAAKTKAARKVSALAMLQGIGLDSAALLVREFFAWRDFHNRREVAGAAGLGGTPYSSGTIEHEQGISKAGNPRVRTRMVELAWLWLRLQPDSHLTHWFERRFANEGSRRRRTGIVAMARRLLIELWHFIEHGVVPKGARLKAVS